MTKKIIKNRAIIEDNWVHITDEESIPSDSDVRIIVSCQHWANEREALLNRNAPLGVTIGNGISVDKIIEDIQHFETIAIEFPEFKDGRGYSYARLLRDRLGYKKDIRAIGNVLRDQLFYMERCGINCFELAQGHDPKDALKAFDEFTVKYQPAVDSPATVL